MSLVVSGDALMAFKSNAGFFYEAADAAMPAIRNYSAESCRLYLTRGQTAHILKAIQEVLSGPKYCTRQGREYVGLRTLQEHLQYEQIRQFR